jgi:hypothetical protein
MCMVDQDNDFLQGAVPIIGYDSDLRDRLNARQSLAVVFASNKPGEVSWEHFSGKASSQLHKSSRWLC